MFRGTERNGTVGARDSNTKMDLEGKHDFKRIDLAFFCSGDDDYLGFDNTGGKGGAVPLHSQRVPGS